MRSLGKLVGWSRSRRWIIRGELIPPMGATVVNEDLRVLGRIIDVFGPVARPYISVDPRKTTTRAFPGAKIYFLTSRDAKAGRWNT